MTRRRAPNDDRTQPAMPRSTPVCVPLLLAALVSLGPATTSAQQYPGGPAIEPFVIERLPPVDDVAPTLRLPPVTYGGVPFGPPADRLAMVPPSGDNSSYFNDPRNPVMPPEVLAPDGRPPFKAPLPPSKDGMVQWTTLRGTTLLPGNRATGMGITDLTWQTILGIPFFTRDKPLLITPYFGAHWINGPQQLDLPGVLYDTSLEFRIFRQVTPRLMVDFAAAPSIYSDFQNMGPKAYRVTGRGVAMYWFSERWQIAGGVAYLGWATLPVLPVGGLIWVPSDDWRLEAIVPRPRLVRRLQDGPQADWWFYTAGEVGGNSYAIKLTDGADDVVTYRDFRFELGLERKGDRGTYARFEIGYVFGRKITYESQIPGFEPSGTLMFRGEAIF